MKILKKQLLIIIKIILDYLRTTEYINIQRKETEIKKFICEKKLSLTIKNIKREKRYLL